MDKKKNVIIPANELLLSAYSENSLNCYNCRHGKIIMETDEQSRTSRQSSRMSFSVSMTSMTDVSARSQRENDIETERETDNETPRRDSVQLKKVSSGRSLPANWNSNQPSRDSPLQHCQQPLPDRPGAIVSSQLKQKSSWRQDGLPPLRSGKAIGVTTGEIIADLREAGIVRGKGGLAYQIPLRELTRRPSVHLLDNTSAIQEPASSSKATRLRHHCTKDPNLEETDVLDRLKQAEQRRQRVLERLLENQAEQRERIAQRLAGRTRKKVTEKLQRKRKMQEKRKRSAARENVKCPDVNNNTSMVKLPSPVKETVSRNAKVRPGTVSIRRDPSNDSPKR